VRQLVVAPLSNRDAPRRRDQTVGISVLFTRVITCTSRAKRHSITFQHSLDAPNKRHQTLSRQRSAIIRATDGSAKTRYSDPFCTTGTENLSLLYIPTLAFANLIARRDTGARSRTSSATIWFLHASCRDYLADERIVHARRIRRCTGWTKKVREEEDGDQGVEEERKAHTRAWFQ